jgi:hypothetical protein
MTDASAGTLTYQFKADLSDLRKGLADIKSQLSQMGTQAQAASRQISDGMDQARKSSDGLTQSVGNGRTVLGSFVRGIAFGGAITAFALLAKAATDYVAQLREMSDVAKRTYQDVAQVSGLVSAGQKSGIKGDTITSGLDSLGAKANKEMREGEGDLTKLLEANNLKLTDRNGKLKSTNDLLMDAARLIQNAGTEYDKLDFAETFGLTKDWVRLLEKGPEELQRSQQEATALGGAFDRELAAKAAQFESAWDSAWEKFKNYGKAAIWDVAAELVKLANQTRDYINNQPGAVLKRQQSEAAGFAAGGIIADLAGGKKPVQGPNLPPEQGPPSPPAWWTGKPSVNPSGGKKGGDGGGGATTDAVENYVASLERSKAVLQQEIDLFGKMRTEVEAAKALEMARAAAKKEGRDLTEAEVQKVRQLGTAYGSLKDKLEELRDRQQSMLQVAQTFASAIADWAINGTKAKDVFASLAKSIANMALQATLMGQGPLAGLFGTKSADGGNSLGGLFGAFTKGIGGGGGFGDFIGPRLPGFAAGGTVPSNQWAIVGEKGPELIRSGSGGASVIPNNVMAAQGGRQASVFHIDARGAQVGVAEQITSALKAYDAQLSRSLASRVNESGYRYA